MYLEEQVDNMQANADMPRLKLPAMLDLAAAEGLLDRLRRSLAAPSGLEIDASEVEVLTLACVQIILAALRLGRPIAIENPSPAFVAAFEDLGLDVSAQCPASSAAPDDKVAEVKSLGNADCPPLQPEAHMSKRILTIDDSKTIRDMLLFTLADAGFEVLQAVDGRDGLDVLEKEHVDLVITDINMPRMDGYEVIRQMRSRAAHKSTPILVLTTESEADKRNVARVAGATGWLVKPFDPGRLIETIHKVAC
jgi:two-component system chemotaxis response regulator CheY